jgi:lamin B
VEAKLKTSESESLEFKSRYEQVQSEATRQKEELEKLRPHLTDLESQLSQIKKQLENETLLRVDLENKNQTLKEDLQFKSQIYDKEICQLRSSKRVEIEQVDVRLRDEYDSKLVNELQRIRDETELKIREMKDDVERRYQAKLNDAESLAKRSKQVTETLREEINSFKLKTAELQTEINSLQSRNTNNENRVKELEEKLRKANLKYEKDMLEKDNELNTARKEVQEVLTEYQELYDIKIALDMEIAAYRKLLESEEQRLNLSSSVHHQTSQLSSSYLDTSNVAAASTSTRGNRKRRMPSNVEIEVEQSSVELEQSQQTSCGVEIGKHDMDAKSVQLTNTTDKEINIGNWLIRRSADGKESEYKLPKSLVLKPAQTVTVWSSNSGKAHEPPNDLVMTQQNKWVVGDSMITILVDKDSNEQARRESKKLTDHKKLRQSTTTTPNKLSTSQQSTSSSAVSRLFGLWK